jgi:hypothetical protein
LPDNKGSQTKPSISRFDLRRVNRSGSLNPADYEVRVMQVACANFFGNVFSYMFAVVPGRCLRRSRLSIAHPGAASLRAERMAIDKRRRGMAPVPLLVSFE